MKSFIDPDELFSLLRAEQENSLKESVREVANAYSSIYDSFREVSFTDEQAFELTKLVIDKTWSQT